MTDKNKNVVERYTVRDAQNYKLGRFVFEKGILELKTEEDAKEFADLLSNAAVMVTRAIRRTDLTNARAIVAAHKAKGSIAHQGGADSLTNRAQPGVPDMNEANAELDMIPEGSMDDPILEPDADVDPAPEEDKIEEVKTPSFSLKT